MIRETVARILEGTHAAGIRSPTHCHGVMDHYEASNLLRLAIYKVSVAYKDAPNKSFTCVV